jgi:CRISPR/Cas system-associated exonuclease Cas4 (RecB family)
VLELNISWSQLRSHTECRRKAHLQRQGKKAEMYDARVYFPGTVVDRAMRNWLNDEARRPGGMAAMIEGIAAHEEQYSRENGDGIVRWKHPRDCAEVIAFCQELVTKLEPLLYENVLPYEFEPAMRFRAPIEIPYLDGTKTVVHLTGEMDILVRDPGWVAMEGSLDSPPAPWQVLDLKATRDDSYWRKTMGQLVFYDIACFAMFQQFTHFTGLIQPMCKEQIVGIRVENQQRVEMMQRIISMAHDIWSDNFPVAPTTSPCSRCDVKHACTRFSPVGGRGDRIGLGMGIPSLSDLRDVAVDEAQAELPDFVPVMKDYGLDPDLVESLGLD